MVMIGPGVIDVVVDSEVENPVDGREIATQSAASSPRPHVEKIVADAGHSGRGRGRGCRGKQACPMVTAITAHASNASKLLSQRKRI